MSVGIEIVYSLSLLVWALGGRVSCSNKSQIIWSHSVTKTCIKARSSISLIQAHNFSSFTIDFIPTTVTGWNHGTYNTRAYNTDTCVRPPHPPRQHRHKMWDKNIIPVSTYLRRKLSSIRVSHCPRPLSCHKHSETHHPVILSVKLLSFHVDNCNNALLSSTDSGQLSNTWMWQPSHSQTDFFPSQSKGRVCLRSPALALY